MCGNFDDACTHFFVEHCIRHRSHHFVAQQRAHGFCLFIAVRPHHRIDFGVDFFVADSDSLSKDKFTHHKVPLEALLALRQQLIKQHIAVLPHLLVDGFCGHTIASIFGFLVAQDAIGFDLNGGIAIVKDCLCHQIVDECIHKPGFCVVACILGQIITGLVLEFGQ